MSIETAHRTQGLMHLRDRLILTGLIGILTGVVSVYFAHYADGDAGDFRYCLGPIRDWLVVRNPYLPYITHQDPYAVPYPFTAILLSLPLAWLPDRIAAGLFIGLGSGLLAWFTLRSSAQWRLWLFYPGHL